MSKELIEYRVVPVTRYIVTKCRTGAPPEAVSSVGECGEFPNLRNANAIAQALADREPYAKDGSDGVEVRVIPFDQAPGRVMRAKVTLTERRPSIQIVWGGEAKGRTEVRPNSQGRDYIWVDPEDPANYKADGEGLTFNAVWAGGAKDGKNACLENHIFSDATPSFNLSCHIRNPDVLAALERGEEYYVDFIRAPRPAT